MFVTESAQRLLRINKVEELISCIWSGTNDHDTSSFYLLKVAGPEEGEPSPWMLSGLFQSVTAENNGHPSRTFASVQGPRFRRPSKIMLRINSVKFHFQGGIGLISKIPNTI